MASSLLLGSIHASGRVEISKSKVKSQKSKKETESIEEVLENIPTITQVNNILIAIIAVRGEAIGIRFESAWFSRQISHEPLMRP